MTERLENSGGQSPEKCKIWAVLDISISFFTLRLKLLVPSPNHAFKHIKLTHIGTSLVVRRLRICAPNAGCPGFHCLVRELEPTRHKEDLARPNK